jgi:polyferredoxin
LKKEHSGKHRLIQTLRVVVQTLFFMLFFYLLLETHISGKEFIGAVERFFHFDPLLGLTTFIASRAFFKAFIWALITVAITIIMGRYVCGWVCPLGTLHQFFSFLFKKLRWAVPKLEGNRLLSAKYAILLFILAGSIFTLNLAGFLDPLSFLYRFFAIVALPSMQSAADANVTLLPKVGIYSTSERMAQSIQDLMINKTFHQGLLIGSFFLMILLLNMYRERFWCRYICPAGAMLGVLAKWNLVKVQVNSDKCIQCNLCNLHCETQAAPFPSKNWRPTECIYCYTCASICPKSAISFPIRMSSAESKSIDFSRRKLILTYVLGMVTVPFFRISSSRPSEKLIRPPGSIPESRFLATCVRCAECMKVCPTNGLQAALNEAGPEGFWTPVLSPRIGYCEYYCSLCTQVCPTGAIKEMSIKEKTQVRIGSAWVKKHRCIPYTTGERCTVCEEQCPTSPKAINLVDADVLLPDGSVITQRVPIVDYQLCIGCGKCETKCPQYDEPAIYCTSMGESRAENADGMIAAKMLR